jgi:hypothetical protein
MRQNETGLGTPLSKKDLKELLTETKETLAADAKTGNTGRTFGSIDMWNLQKRKKTSASFSRRFM